MLGIGLSFGGFAAHSPAARSIPARRRSTAASRPTIAPDSVLCDVSRILLNLSRSRTDACVHFDYDPTGASTGALRAPLLLISPHLTIWCVCNCFRAGRRTRFCWEEHATVIALTALSKPWRLAS